MRKIVKVRPVFVNFSSSFRPNAQCGNVLQNRKFLSFHLVFFYTFALKKMIMDGLWTNYGRKLDEKNFIFTSFRKELGVSFDFV